MIALGCCLILAAATLLISFIYKQFFKFILNLEQVICVIKGDKIILSNNSFNNIFLGKNHINQKYTVPELFKYENPGVLHDLQERIWYVNATSFLRYKVLTFQSAQTFSWLDNIPLSCALIDKNGLILKSNNKSYFGTLKNQIRENIYNFIPKARHKDFQDALERASLSWVHLDVFWKDVTYMRIYIKQHTNGTYILTLFDLTEMELLRQQAQKAQSLQVLGALATGVVHDFNNMLNALMGLVFNLSNKQEANKNDMRNITTIITRAQELIKQLLTLSTQKDIDKKCNLAHLIKDSLHILKLSCEHKCQLNFSFKENCIVNLSPSQVLQIITNLILNAQQANASVINISIEKQQITGALLIKSGTLLGNTYALLTVEDNGDGIDGKVEQTLFKSFGTTKKEGAGVGLACLARMLEMEGGGIDFYSNYKGTKFFVYIPIDTKNKDVDEELNKDKGASEIIKESILPIKMDNQKINKLEFKATILLIEDDSMIRELTSRALRYRGYDVIEAENGQQALDKFNERVDCIITDALMPVMNGIQFIKKIAQIGVNVPILLISGLNPEEFADQIPQQIKHNVKILTKPLQIKDMLKVMEEVITTR